ncbi:SHPS1 phosphatase, partial [Polypterus senegalus]
MPDDVFLAALLGVAEEPPIRAQQLLQHPTGGAHGSQQGCTKLKLPWMPAGVRGTAATQGAARVTQEPKQVEAEEGSSITLGCILLNETPLGPVRWYKGTGSGRQHFFSAAPKESEKNDLRVRWAVENPMVNYSISVRDVRVNDTGKYYCEKFSKVQVDKPYASGTGVNLVVRVLWTIGISISFQMTVPKKRNRKFHEGESDTSVSLQPAKEHHPEKLAREESERHHLQQQGPHQVSYACLDHLRLEQRRRAQSAEPTSPGSTSTEYAVVNVRKGAPKVQQFELVC